MSWEKEIKAYLLNFQVLVSIAAIFIFLYARKLVARLPFLFGGWPLSAYIYYLTWRNFSIIFLEYRFYAILYLGIFTIISLAVCYRMGPPEDERSLNLMEWTLQIIALATIYFFNQSRIYTRMELENLRQFCNSQNSKTNWQLVSRLKRPNRMASFITGDSDHVSAMEFSYHSEIYCQNEGSDEENSYLEEGYITDDD
uniref:Uncharacterized protein n=1 Tax=Meloidogyne javanica TaxID=6303 RepID=A0A915LYQ6_MELJA